MLPNLRLGSCELYHVITQIDSEPASKALATGCSEEDGPCVHQNVLAE